MLGSIAMDCIISEPCHNKGTISQRNYREITKELLENDHGQGAHSSGKGQGNLIFLQGQGKVREFCKMFREIRKFFKVREKSGNFKIVFVQIPQKLNKQYEMMTVCQFWDGY